MRTQIKITGQVAGNNRLEMHIQPEALKVERFFNDRIVFFQTKKEARKALRTAYKNLKELEPDFYRDGGISLVRGELLVYDASKARMV